MKRYWIALVIIVYIIPILFAVNFWIITNDTISQIISGVIASLVAIVVWDGVKIVFECLEKRKIKVVLLTKRKIKECNIVLSVRKNQTGGRENMPATPSRDAFAIGYVSELYNRLNIRSNFFTSDDIRNKEPAFLDTVSIGGPGPNKITEDYLKKYCPGFERRKDEKLELNEERERKNVNIAVFNCGGYEFKENHEKDFGFLVKITEKEQTVFLVFGCGSGYGTQAAALYLWKHYEKLYKEFKEKKFFIAVEVTKNLGPNHISSEYCDLTREAFTQPLAS